MYDEINMLYENIANNNYTVQSRNNKDQTNIIDFQCSIEKSLYLPIREK